MIIVLQLESTGGTFSNHNGKISDLRCSWYPSTHGLTVRKTCRLAAAYHLFGEGGIASSTATIGIALRWISSKSNERGVVPFGTITKADSAKSFDVDYVFERGTLKGSLKLQTILYLKDAGTPKESEKYFAQQTGTILGVLEQEEFFVDGNGSVFPIAVIDAPGKALWNVYYNDASDPMQDKFESENVEIRLNKAHPNYDALKIECFWDHYEEELRRSGDLLYTWQYDIRWAATELRKTGFMIEATESPRGIWQLK